MHTGVLSLLTLFVSLVTVLAKIDPTNLRCLVCRRTIDEFENAIMNVDPRKTVEIGNYRLDGDGNIHQKKIPLSKSQVHLSELLDGVCSKMADYVRVRYKATGKLAIMKMMTASGTMNPEFSLTDFVQDEDLNKSLEFYCEGLLGENEDFIVDLYSKRDGDSMPDGKEDVCTGHLQLCEDWMLPNTEDLSWSPEDQKNRGPDPFGFGGQAANMPQEDGDDDIVDMGELTLGDKEEL